MNLKDLFTKKPVGFYVTLTTIGLSLVTALAYFLCYNNTDNFNLWSFIILLASAVIGVILILLKQFKLVPYAIGFLNYVAMLFYVYGIYYYVSVVLVGIDLDHFEIQFFISTISFIILVIVSIVAIFMKQTKSEEVA